MRAGFSPTPSPKIWRSIGCRKSKGWGAIAKLKKEKVPLVRFGWNLAQLFRDWPWSSDPGYTQNQNIVAIPHWLGGNSSDTLTFFFLCFFFKVGTVPILELFWSHFTYRLTLRNFWVRTVKKTTLYVIWHLELLGGHQLKKKHPVFKENIIK